MFVCLFVFLVAFGIVTSCLYNKTNGVPLSKRHVAETRHSNQHFVGAIQIRASNLCKYHKIR